MPFIYGEVVLSPPNDKSDTPFLPQHVATFDLNWDLMFIQDPFSDVSPT